MLDNDDKRIWKEIDWQGRYKENRGEESAPSDEEFRVFFESVYSPPNVEALNPGDIMTDVYVQVLDDPIQVQEVIAQMGTMKANKSCGPDGLSPGVLKILPAQWILTILVFYNTVFTSGCYPSSWRFARVLTVFKRGNKRSTMNYRGKNVINCLVKLLDFSIEVSIKFLVCSIQRADRQPKG